MSRFQSLGTLVVFACAALIGGASARAADVFLRFRVVDPPAEKLHVTVGGYRHEDPWYLPKLASDVPGGAWSPWLDLSKWPWHGRLNRAGGIAEWPAITLSVTVPGQSKSIAGCALDVQLADRADESGIVHRFTERSGSDTIAFLVPTPLREHASEFETGSQMTARQLAWAKAASGGKPAILKDFTLITALWGHYDPALAAQAIETLKQLGFNVIGNADTKLLHREGIRSYQTTWLYEPDPREVDQKWKAFADAQLKRAEPSEENTWRYAKAAHWVVGDEVQTLNFNGVAGVDGWFRDYLRDRHVTADALGKPLEQIHYPAEAMYEKTLPRGADLPTRRLMYHAAKFGQWWSAKQLAHLSGLVRASLPGAQTETLPSDHGFLNAWGAPYIGMSYRMLDLFELGKQRAVDQLSAEDWAGLNHMYGPAYTWTGAQTFEYFNAICRSATLDAPADSPILLRGLITPSDDGYLRLKAYSSIGQGAKSFFFWTFGPTYIGTENYWSDLRSEYDGIAKLSRMLQKAAPVLMSAKPVRDPVAILYSISHDIWHSDDPAAFVEKRLLWHGLRHLHVQPDFLREEDVEGDKLKGYKALYITDACITRAASAKIDAWVKSGGVVYLSAGAATRDEFDEPFVPPFAATVWPADAAKQLKTEAHAYNERVDLPTIKPITTASIDLAGKKFALPVLGVQSQMKTPAGTVFARFADESPAGVQIAYDSGKVFAVGFLPMLAYAQAANFKPVTLEERWPAAPREIPKAVLDAAGITLVARCDQPVVETSLLAGGGGAGAGAEGVGGAGAALVLVNYTYRPIDMLAVELKISRPITRATSTEGSDVKLEKIPGGVRLHLPLAWTDLILLQ